jgi:hypothetical protein
MRYYNDQHYEGVLSETILYNDIVAGTADLLFFDLSNGCEVIADIKTTATLHKEALSWQLSIYAYLANDTFTDVAVDKGQAFHFDKDGNLNVVDIPLKPVEEVKRLFDCERKGEIYKQDLTAYDYQLEELSTVEAVIKHYETLKKQAEEQAQEMRSALLDAMAKNGAKSLENDKVRITYIEPSTRTAIDSTRLKKEMPEIAEKYSKTSQTKASLRITLKEANNE